MPEVTVNLTAVIIAAVANIIIGSVWYSPALFGKQWMDLVGFKATDMKKKEMGKSYLAAFGVALLTAYVLANILGFAGAKTAVGGAQVGFWSWLGFSFTTMSGAVIWLKKPLNLLAI